MKTKLSLEWIVLATIVSLLVMTIASPVPALQIDQPDSPDHVIKLIFIHHSTGENWLRDDYGGLGLALDQNNYFVSDTNYGWGPDAIGDRTDIPNWPEWFASESTPRYMEALFNENGQNAAYTRTLNDPGGENEIIVFKSCFPNSALEGHPSDAPDAEGWLSVGHAKYVYNEILKYFATRPDKLFVVITAPPLSDSTYSENARAFNDWLLNDWLAENHYTLNNVAVFDFYNVLTSPDAHHRYANGQIEHLLTNRNTLAYPSDDDHPSAQGSRKATTEFLPLLNIFYHRWQSSGSVPAPTQAATVPPAEATQPPADEPAPATLSDVIDDFEGGAPSGTAGWEPFFQDGTDTQATCAADRSNAHSGSASLQFKFDVTANSWSTCGFYFDAVQDWRAGEGLAFYLHADQPNLAYDIDLYGGTPGGRTTHIYHAQTPPESVNGWVLVQVRWEEILRAEWEENTGTPFNPAEVTGLAFGLSTPEQSRMQGTLWIDDLQLLGAAAPVPPTQAQAPTPEPVAEKQPAIPCLGALALPLLLGLVWVFQRRLA